MGKWALPSRKLNRPSIGLNIQSQIMAEAMVGTSEGKKMIVR